jgi:hypothetical protein
VDLCENKVEQEYTPSGKVGVFQQAQNSVSSKHWPLPQGQIGEVIEEHFCHGRAMKDVLNPVIFP